MKRIDKAFSARIGQKRNAIFLALILLSCITSIAQTTGIISGGTYTISPQVSAQLLNVHNSSMSNSAEVNLWTNTSSDAQRWQISAIDESLFTIKNIGTGHFLHSTRSIP
ncbi:MAG: RICIN domain-containing protein, partial [Bacteroidales bacterium]|nr:RICIN domain-containing protein [Bacteroidales bacterium]